MTYQILLKVPSVPPTCQSMFKSCQWQIKYYWMYPQYPLLAKVCLNRIKDKSNTTLWFSADEIKVTSHDIQCVNSFVVAFRLLESRRSTHKMKIPQTVIISLNLFGGNCSSSAGIGLSRKLCYCSRRWKCTKMIGIRLIFTFLKT